MRMIFELLAATFALGGQTSGSAGLAQSIEIPELCRTQSPSDIIEIRVIRPGVVFRIQPGPDEIVKSGEGFRVTRGSPIWERFARQICNPSKRATAREKDNFVPRIVVFLSGSSTRNAAILEFPREDLGSNAVDYSFNGLAGTIDNKEVRLLLDFAARMD